MKQLPAFLVFTLVLALSLPACTAAQDASSTDPPAALRPDGPSPTVPFGLLRLTHVRTLRGSHVKSPKSAVLSPDGNRFHINSPEGFETVVYNSDLGTCFLRILQKQKSAGGRSRG